MGGFLTVYFLRKLGRFARLTDAEKSLLARTFCERPRLVPARQDMVREGEPSGSLLLFESGWAYRHRMLEDGRRQILSLFLPGDFTDLNPFVLSRVDHSIGTLTTCVVREVMPGALEKLMAAEPRIAQALWWAQQVGSSIQREWTLNLGQRTAFERLAHVFCEIFVRLDAVGLTDGQSCELPLTQTDLADMTGLSTVHVNRTLQELRAAGLIALSERRLTIQSFEALACAGLFDRTYLHLDGAGRRLDAAS